MRTDEQILSIKETQSPPVQLYNVLSNDKIKSLIDFYSTNPKEEKVTGPVVSYVEEGQGIIDDILLLLRNTFGNFNVRVAHYFDVKHPHIIHIDDHYRYPNSYKAFTIPLEIRGTTENKANLIFFDQYYYGGPAKFINKGNSKDMPVHFNEFITSYENVHNINDQGIHPYYLEMLSHLKEEWYEGLSIQKHIPWTIGSIIAFDSLQLHCASNFLKTGATSKLGLSIFTTFD
jgi:hypothetical protein